MLHLLEICNTANLTSVQHKNSVPKFFKKSLWHKKAHYGTLSILPYSAAVIASDSD